MRDKRPVDELSIEELERILAIRKREARQARLGRYERRRVGNYAEPVDPSITKPRYPGAPLSAPAPMAEPVVADDLDLKAVGSTAPAEPQFEDEFDRRPRVKPAGRDARVVWWNRGLVVVEVGAVIGLVLLFISLFTSLQQVTQTTAQIQSDFQATSAALQVPPTATPTINIAQVVLPGGHTYDVASDSARFNLDEVPAQYREAYQQLVLNVSDNTPPTESPQGPLTVRIPAINVESAVVTGDGWNELQRGVGHHVGSANPGEAGNMVLSAHNDVFGETFRYLEKLQAGDKIYVTTQNKEYVYVVQGHEIVEPNEVRVLDNSRRDKTQVTLITCYPYRVDTRRYIVYGILETP